MMKKIGLLFIFVFIIAAAILLYVQQKTPPTDLLKDTSVPEIAAFEALQATPINWTDVATTAELKTLFEGAEATAMPRIFVRQFPSDFDKEGTPVLLATVLLPHLIRQNELLAAERTAFLALADKLKAGQPLTPKEESFWNNLFYKYEVLNPDKVGQEETLFQRVDKISPSLAVAQSLEATNGGKIHLDSPFDVRRWNAEKQYDFVRYPDLAAAVADYALELNRGYAYVKFHMLRNIHRPSRYSLPGRVFTRGVDLYKMEDTQYVQKLQELFDWYQFHKLDFAAFAKDKE